MVSQDWRAQAACRDNPEMFFPVGNEGPALVQVAEAKAVCRRCPVASECLEWALENGEDAGVWGGMSEDERRDIHRKARRSGSVARDAEIRQRLDRGETFREIEAGMRTTIRTIRRVDRSRAVA